MKLYLQIIIFILGFLSMFGWCWYGYNHYNKNKNLNNYNNIV